jgi:hypothetical protein
MYIFNAYFTVPYLSPLAQICNEIMGKSLSLSLSFREREKEREREKPLIIKIIECPALTNLTPQGN